MNKETEVDFDDVDRCLEKVDADVEAAEAHGTLCGILCIHGQGDINLWLSQIVGDQDPRDIRVKEAQSLLMDLHDGAVEQLNDGNYELQLLLREDSAPLEDRVYDLTQWCQGFLFGLAAAGIKDLSTLPEDAEEIMTDIVEISKAGYDAAQEDEENEEAYYEVVEYIRLGVFIIYNQYNTALNEASKTTIH